MLHRTAELTPFGRRLLVERILVEGWSAAIAAETLGVSRATAYKWLRHEEIAKLERALAAAVLASENMRRLFTLPGVVAAAVGHATQPLDVDVDQLIGSLAHIAQRHPGQAIGMGQPAHAVAAQDTVDRGARMAQERTQRSGPTQQPTTEAQDAAHLALVD